MDRRIELVLEKLESRKTYEWTIAEFAKSVNLSTSRFRHLFKSELGRTPTQFLKEMRLKESEKLLIETFLSIKEIAASAGICSASYFVREFKKFSGLSPSEYRKKFGLHPDKEQKKH